MPKAWTATVEQHRSAIRGAILESAWALVRERGPLALTMSQIAERAGIGRATLYKYFPDVEAILVAAHHGQVAQHLAALHDLAAQPLSPVARLEAVLLHYAAVAQHREQPTYDAVRALLHEDAVAGSAHQELTAALVELLASAVAAGELRDDVDPGILAEYCVSALGAAGNLAGGEAPQVLVHLVLDSLRPAAQAAR